MNNSINQREKAFGFIYVLILFLIFTTFFCWLLFYKNSNFRSFSQKEYAVSKMNNIVKYQNAEAQYITLVDSLDSKINSFNPGINAIYEENDINYIINTLKNVYEKQSWDHRYKSFFHVAEFYEMWLVDKKDLWNKRQNVQLLKKNLEECEIGLKNKNDMKKPN